MKRVLQLYVQGLVKEIPREGKDIVVSTRPIFDPDVALYQWAFNDMRSNYLDVSGVYPV